MLQFRWVRKDEEEEKTKVIQEQYGLNRAIAVLLAQRSLTTKEDIKQYIEPHVGQLHNPLLMQDMERAVIRIETALLHGEKIMVYGDYDVDGTTSVALVGAYFKQLVKELILYIPDRYTEGYGVSAKGITHAIHEGVSLMIILDCGIRAHERIEEAKRAGIDCIICDHHNPGETLPKAFAILNPKRSDCQYPNKELSGCGIGYKLLQAFHQRTYLPTEMLEEGLDLVALSIACDIVQMTGENRVLAALGLQRMNRFPRGWLKKLPEISRIKLPFEVEDLVFKIGPRINAAGRLAHGLAAVELLTGKTDEEILNSSFSLDSLNRERSRIDKDITSEAIERIKTDSVLYSKKTTVLYNPEWHKGVIGIVASRLVEEFYRPTVVLTESEGILSGSARSVKGFDLYEALQACESEMIEWGGHMYAAGMKIKPEKLAAFSDKFEEIVTSKIEVRHLTPEIEIDLSIDLFELTIGMYTAMMKLAPFGPGNMKPVFLTKNLQDTGNSKVLNELHLKIELQDGNGYIVKGIGFGKRELFSLLQHKACVDILYHLEINEWKDKKELQVRILDIRPSETTTQY